MTTESDIRKELEPIARRQRLVRLWCALALCWACSALLAALVWWLERYVGWRSSLALPLVALIGVGAGAVFFTRSYRRRPGLEEIAVRIESRHPELNGRLVTALQQRPEPGGRFGFLQQRLISETLELARRADWAAIVPVSRLRLIQTAHWLACVFFALGLLALRRTGGHQWLARSTDRGVEITPGDVSLERGSSLVVLARFKGPLPPKVELAFGEPAALQRVSLVKSLGDPMFGGSIQDLSSNFVYRVEYGGQVSRDYKVTVYEHPRLERADADVTFPAYTGLPRKRIPNTRRLSAVQGAQVDLSLQFNKPVASARLVSRDKEKTAVPLALDPGHPAATLKDFSLQDSKTYDLQLVDLEGRTNKVPAEFVFEALKNRLPEMKLTAPRGDIRPSPLEEISFEGTIWDDFGVPAFGLAYSVDGGEPKFIELGKDVHGNEKKPFKHLLRLEDLGVKPDELLSWFVWADDLGPDGKLRRNMGDLYFGEVRPFEEVFREGQGMEGQGAQGQGGEDKTGKLTDLQKQIVNATWRLQRDHPSTGDAKPVKEGSKPPASNATPRSNGQSGVSDSRRYASLLARVNPRFAAFGQVTRSGAAAEPSRKPSGPRASSSATSQPPKYEDDANVVQDSQAQVLEEAKQALQRQHDPQTAALWQKAIAEMESALARLERASKSPEELKEALAAEQAAYQALIRVQAHEYQVSRSRSQSQGGSSRNQQLQLQLQEMDLTESENRYENQREAQRAQNPERREQLQMMSRLQELARRQQDLNERLKELQSALQEARTEKERAEIQRQLKRLQEEEQQMLADVDELKQKMDRPENQSRLADERRQLDQTRQEVQKASEAASQGSASQALAAGTRAQTQLQQLRDDMRKKNSSQFADDLRQLRNQARELDRRQEDILKKLQQSPTDRKSLSASQDQEQTLAQISRQKELMTNLLDRASQVSQQAEEAEPLASHQLYDSVRKFTQDTAKDLKEAESELVNRGPMTRSLFELLRDNSEQGGAKLEEITAEMVRLGYPAQASQVGEKARSGIQNLKKGVERAAGSVLGDDTEDLRLAQKQLDDLANQLNREIADNQADGSRTNGTRSGNSAQRGEGGKPGSDGTNALARSQDPGQRGNGENPSAGQNQQEGPGSRQPGEQASTAGQPSSDSPGEQSSASPGKGSSTNPGEQASANPGDQASKNPGEQASTNPGDQASANPGQQNQGSGQQPGEGQGAAATGDPNKAGQPGQTPGRNAAGQRAARGQPRQNDARPGAGANGDGDPLEADSAVAAGGGARNFDLDRLLSENARRQNAPLTGENFNSWSDGLREVEELIDAPDLRDDVAKAREQARLFRQDFKRERKKPDWAVVRLQVMKPLTEVRDRIAEELARRGSREALVPLDRDPVPNRYSDLVRRYYEELGKDK